MHLLFHIHVQARVVLTHGAERARCVFEWDHFALEVLERLAHTQRGVAREGVLIPRRQAVRVISHDLLETDAEGVKTRHLTVWAIH
jgi:hypothetical protein